LLAARPSCLYVTCPFIWSVVVRWLDGSFAFFCLALCVEKNANVPTKALALSCL